MGGMGCTRVQVGMLCAARVVTYLTGEGFGGKEGQVTGNPKGFTRKVLMPPEEVWLVLL